MVEHLILNSHPHGLHISIRHNGRCVYDCVSFHHLNTSTVGRQYHEVMADIYQTPRVCEICGQPFLAKDCRGRWCQTCVPPLDQEANGLARLYGLSRPAYDALVEAQGGRCKICGRTPSGQRNFKRLHVDHNHETGEVRGLLCPRCNVAVGFVESHENIEEVVDYLQHARCQATRGTIVT